MRLRLTLCIVLPVCLLALGAGILFYAHSVSDALLQPLDSVEELALERRFDEIDSLLAHMEAYWERHSDLLMLVIDHDIIDSISLEINALRGAQTARSAADVLIASQRLRVHARHLFRRDLPLVENLL